MAGSVQARDCWKCSKVVATSPKCTTAEWSVRTATRGAPRVAAPFGERAWCAFPTGPHSVPLREHSLHFEATQLRRSVIQRREVRVVVDTRD